MKVTRTILLLVAIMGVIDSCTKTETKTSAATTNGALLAGAMGASKSWKIFSISESYNGGTPQSVTASSGIPACEADNVFQFSNNAAQSYTNTEGATLCNTGDPATIESGSWAFTSDGKSLLIDASVNITVKQLQSSGEPYLGYMLLEEGQALNVSLLTSTSMTVSYTYVDTSVSPADTYLVTLQFASM